MDNRANQHEALGGTVASILLKVKLSGLLTDDEFHALNYAAGIAVDPHRESRLQRLQRMLREAQEYNQNVYEELNQVKRIGG